MYAVIHGGIDKELRKKSCEYLTSLPFDGFAIGGSVGKTREQMIEMLSFVMPQLPKEKPNHLLGIGDLESLDACVRLGVDTFDCSHPTRCARHGLLFTKNGFHKIVQSINKTAFEPVDASCQCFTCRHYTKAYLHHLFKAKELIGYSLATIHNLHFMVQLMKDYRQAIMNNEL